jgi:hypothetical protein
MQFPKRNTLVAAAVGAGAVVTAAAPASAVTTVSAEQHAQVLDPVAERAEAVHERVLDRHIRLYRDNLRLRGKRDQIDTDRREVVEGWSTIRLRERNAGLENRNERLRAAARDRARGERRAARRAAAAPGGAVTATGGGAGGGATAAPGNLQAIAQCESGGDPGAVGGGGTYRGKYQFDQQTWASVGGSGDPAAASESEQDQRAAALYAQRGTAPWPTCGR